MQIANLVCDRHERAPARERVRVSVRARVLLVCVCVTSTRSRVCASLALFPSLSPTLCVCVCVFREQRKMWPNKSSDQKQLLFVVSRGELRCIDLSSLSVHSKVILPIFGGFE
jgi:hypothetical protein